MSYERQDSISRLQLYRDRKVERMAAMRRAVDEGRTTAVSSASPPAEKSTTRQPRIRLVGKCEAELRALPDHIQSELMAALAPQWLTHRRKLNSEKLDTWQRLFLDGGYFIKSPSHPNETARLISELLHRKVVLPENPSNYSMNLHWITAHRLIGNNLQSSRDYYYLISWMQATDIMPAIDFRHQYVSTTTDLIRENLKASWGRDNSFNHFHFKDK